MCIRDSIETFLINLTRGTGLKGLTGIPEVNNNIVRPLLPFSKDELESYAKANHLKWRDDSSNASDKYLRNKLRHHVIPVLKETTPELLQNFKNTLKHLNASAEIIDDHIAAVTENAIDYIDDNQIKFKISEIKNTKNPKAYLYEMFQVYGFTQWNDIEQLLDAQSGKQILSDTHRLVKNREHLILTALRNDDVIKSGSDKSISILESDKMVETPFGTLHIDQVDVISKSLESTVYVDKSKLKFPLELRHWKEGDVFYPSGMTGKKKLSKYFKDEKYSIIDKENAWLLCSGDDIVWVVGKRADERYKVTDSTTYILKIELENLQIT